MSTRLTNGPSDLIRHELEAMKSEWYWFLTLGIMLIIGGTLAIGYSVFFTLVAVTFFGLLLVIGGAADRGLVLGRAMERLPAVAAGRNSLCRRRRRDGGPTARRAPKCSRC